MVKSVVFRAGAAASAAFSARSIAGVPWEREISRTNATYANRACMMPPVGRQSWPCRARASVQKRLNRCLRLDNGETNAGTEGQTPDGRTLVDSQGKMPVHFDSWWYRRSDQRAHATKGAKPNV